MANDYLFAYGSLINVERLGSEWQKPKAIPVEVVGLKRGWYLPVPQDKDTGLGVIILQNSLCNGILLHIDDEKLRFTDQREHIHGYARTQIKLDSVHFLRETPKAIRYIWAYVAESPVVPSLECPIAQSYVDFVLEGCLQFGEHFAKRFIQSTSGWEYPWINDRDKPRYRRAIKVDAERIDEILFAELPEHLGRRDKYY
jgi:hypothetical protein